METLLKGIIIGLSIAAPVGPISVLAIGRTISAGRLYGFVTGMGAAVTDLIYACIGGFGLTIISNFLLSKQGLIRFGGGLFIIFLGYKIFTSRPEDTGTKVLDGGFKTAFLSAFLIAITNPIAIIYYLAVFAGMGKGVVVDYYTASFLAGGVFLGSALWWLILSQSVGLLKKRITLQGIEWINRVSGIIIVCFGIYAIYSSIV